MTTPPTPADLPQRQIGFLLRDLAQRYAARFEFHAQALSLTLPQCRVLVHLEHSPGLSQARLAKLANVDPMAMVRLLDHMETEGLVERLADPEDRRARRVVLTGVARPVIEEIWRLSARTRDETFAGIPPDERVLFESLLQRIHTNLCALDPE